MSIEIKLGYDNSKEIAELFLEYTEMVVFNDPSFEKYLQIQNFDYDV